MRRLSNLGSLLSAILLVVACQGQAGDSSVPEAAHSVSAEADAPATPPRARVRAAAVQLTHTSPHGIGLRIDGGGIRVGARPDHGQLFSTLDCAGCGWTHEVGKPRLPAIRQFVEVPPGHSLAVRLSGRAPVTRPLVDIGARHQVLPVQHPVDKLPGARARAPFVIDQELYASDDFYPARPYRLSAPLFVRGRHLVLVEYYPVRYNPVRGLIETTPDATLELDFAPGAATATNVRVVGSTPAFDGWFRDNVVGYRPRTVKATSTARYAEGFLLVVGDGYAADAGLAAYVEDRRAEGHFVKVVAMSEIGSSDADLRTYVRSEYLSWSEPALSYLLLVGDIADVPTHNGSAGSGGGQATDLYYASIDPDDYASDLLAPDLLVSRISVNDLTELATYIDRADHYIHADFATDQSWLHKLAFAASCDNSGITEGTHDYVIDNYTGPAGYTGTVPGNPQLGGDKLYCGAGDASQPTLQSALGDGRVVVNFSGHGGETFWADPEFTQSYLDGVVPPDAAPFVISNACVTGTFDYGSDCWGEMWLSHSHGAILFWGASNNSYWDEDDILERKLWDGIFLDGITRIADITQNAKLQTLAHYGASGDMEYYFEMYNMLGDGTIDLYTGVPVDATVLYPTEILLGVSEIDVSVEDGGSPIEGALVSVRGDVVQQVGYTDAAGQVTLMLDPMPADVGDLAVTITGHNLRRHEGVIQVIPADGPYLVHDSHAITSDGTTPIDPNPGVHVVMPITIENIGTDPATGITTTLHTSSAFATVTEDQPVFADIAAGATGPSTTHAEFDLHADAADRTSITFELDWTTTAGASGTSRFRLAVERPILHYASHTVSDDAAACDTDDIADAGEPTEFVLSIENRGSGDASDLLVTLSAPDCTVSDPVAITHLAAEAEAVAIFTVTPRASVECPAAAVEFTVTIDSAEIPTGDESSFVELLNADVVSTTFADDLEGAEPNGWSHTAAAGSDDWAYTASSSHSSSHSWFATDAAGVKDDRLVTPAITIGDTAELRFWQRYDFEPGYDGGVLEISTDSGGSYSDLGAYLTQKGYTTTLSDGTDNPIGGRAAWSGSADWHEVVADLSSFGPGEVMIRFRLGCDYSVDAPGWWIDDFSIDAETVLCQVVPCPLGNLPPDANAGPDQEVDVGDLVTLDGSATTDPNGDSVSYGWAQTSGTPVALSDPTAEAPTFTAPAVALVGGEALVFELTAYDVSLHDSDTVTITVAGSCFDDNVCTEDVWGDSACENPPVADGTPCPGGSCEAGECQPSSGPDASVDPDDPGDGGCCSSQRDNPTGGTLLLALWCLAALLRRRRCPTL